MKILVIGKIWPEPRSSAAGTRTLDLLRSLKTPQWDVHFACAAQKSEHSADIAGELEIETHPITLNSSCFDSWVAALAPDIVIFDRYMTEEQFAWRVAKQLPDTLRVVDTSDLHCLREARQQSLLSGKPINLCNEIAHREIAALFRSDLSLVISEFEQELLAKEFALPAESIAYWPFSLPEATQATPGFEERKNFIMIGSFRHEPNWDAVRYCHQEIWPLIRGKCPYATLDVYGSYPPPKAYHLHNEANGFLIRGRTEDAISTLSRYRVNLAPLRFGAGLKGKLADAFLAGTPSAATFIAAEGMHGDFDWGSEVSSDPRQFAETAIKLYTDSDAWTIAQSCGHAIAHGRFSASIWLAKLPQLLQEAYENRGPNRSRNFIGQMLNHHLHRSSEFMSRWIEAKNKTGEPQPPSNTP